MSDTPLNLETQDLESIMRTESGRNVISRMLNYSNVDDDIFNSDPFTHAFNAGRREVGLWLRNEIINAAPERYIQMMKEYIDEQRREHHTSAE